MNEKTKELKGKRVRLIKMYDDYAVPPGTEGSVTHVDDKGTLHMQWDNGRTLGLVPGEDKYEFID